MNLEEESMMKMEIRVHLWFWEKLNNNNYLAGVIIARKWRTCSSAFVVGNLTSVGVWGYELLEVESET
ncbi:hypothetical protein M5689_019759 [Euphorbia peplus]|nr:hypothetical protein M5689_019759 [Euphorbia peplus]